MEKLILIKLGGSVITDKNKPFTPRHKTIKRLVSEIKEIQKIYKGKIIIGHGQGSYAHIPASKYKTHLGIVNKKSTFGFAVVSEMAKRPNTLLTQEFIKQKVSAVSFSPMSFEYAQNSKLKSIFIDPIIKALSLEIIPVVYGDPIFDKAKNGFCIYSGEVTLDNLAGKLKKYYDIEKIIMAGDTNGVYDMEGKTIPHINKSNWLEVQKSITSSKSKDVTGGMLHKVQKSLELAKKQRIKTIIINGNRKGELVRAVKSERVKGTVIT